jgi:hypothetical protein
MGGSSSADSTALTGTSEGKRSFGRPRCRWKDNIQMDLQDVGMDWIKRAQDRDKCQALVNVVMNFGFPKMKRIS